MTFLAMGPIERPAFGDRAHRVADRVLGFQISVRDAAIDEGGEAQHALLLLRLEVPQAPTDGRLLLLGNFCRHAILRHTIGIGRHVLGDRDGQRRNQQACENQCDGERARHLRHPYRRGPTQPDTSPLRQDRALSQIKQRCRRPYPTISLFLKQSPISRLALSGLSEPCTEFRCMLTPKSLRMVPGSASTGFVLPITARLRAMASSPSRIWSTIGPEVMNWIRPL